MNLLAHFKQHWRVYSAVFFLSLLLLPLSLQVASAHALLVRSDPAKDAVLDDEPAQVRMWFSEDLNPTFSTAYVVNATTGAARAQNDLKTHVDQGDAHVASTDSKEMDLSLKPGLSPAVYVVLYRTQSAEDGHILYGSFIFTLKAANGTIPTFRGQLPAQGAFAGSSSDQFNASTLFILLMVTLVDISVVFWVGAQLWQTFVLQLFEQRDEGQREVAERMSLRFDRRFAVPALLVLFLANIGFLVGQAILVTGGQIGQALSPTILIGQVSNGQFGLYWMLREGITLIALVLALLTLTMKRTSQAFDEGRSWANFMLGLGLLIAVTLSGHAAATRSDIVVYAVLSDWLHLLAASLWVGGMFYIATILLPILKNQSPQEEAHSLLTILPRYSPLAITGVLITAASGPFNATTRMSSFDQLLGTLYGRALIVKSLIVCCLLATSAIHVLLLRPRLRKSYDSYRNMIREKEELHAEGTHTLLVITGAEVKQSENKVIQQTKRLSETLRWEPLLGVAVLLCTGLLTVFSGTLVPTTANQPVTGQSGQQQAAQVKPFTTTVTTTDKVYRVKLTIDPNRFGPNTFTATVLDNKGAPVAPNTVGVSLYTTMLDMDMGTDSINLQPDGKGHFSAQGDLEMGGNWNVRVEVRSIDQKVHQANVKFYTPE